MRVKILKRSFAGAEFAPDIRVLKVGGQSSAGVERLEFELPAEWKGLSVTLHVQWLDGTLPAPVLLDDEDSVAVDKTLTASPSGQWMLLALGCASPSADGGLREKLRQRLSRGAADPHELAAEFPGEAQQIGRALRELLDEGIAGTGRDGKIGLK